MSDNEKNEEYQAPDINKQPAIYWWAMLAIAVLAIPSIGFIVAFALPLPNIGRLIVFVITCWLSTWLGMWLMKKSS